MNLTRFILRAAALALSGLVNRFAGVLVKESEPTGVYLRLPDEPERGSMVTLRPLIKRVVAIAGEVVPVAPEGTYVNGTLWPNSSIPSTTPAGLSRWPGVLATRPCAIGGPPRLPLMAGLGGQLEVRARRRPAGQLGLGHAGDQNGDRSGAESGDRLSTPTNTTVVASNGLQRERA